MKKKLIALCLLSITLSANSQVDKGIWLLGGTGSFYNYDQKYSSPTYTTNAEYTSIDLSASVGYFIVDKLATGVRPGFSSFKGEVTGTGGLVTNNKKFLVGPFARYYFLKADKQFNLLADVSYQVGINKNALPPREKGTTSNFSIMAGPEVFFNSSVGLEVLLGYRKSKATIDNSATGYNDSRSGFLVSVGFQIHLEN